MKGEHRRSGRFPIAEVAFSSDELPGEVVQISRTGLRLETPLAAEVGHSMTGSLSYRGDSVEIAGVVRWRREAGSSDRGSLPLWEVGVAFTAVRGASAEGIWRTLSVGVQEPPEG